MNEFVNAFPKRPAVPASDSPPFRGPTCNTHCYGNALCVLVALCAKSDLDPPPISIFQEKTCSTSTIPNSRTRQPPHPKPSEHAEGCECVESRAVSENSREE